MRCSVREQLAKRIVQHHRTVAKIKKNITVNHFLTEIFHVKTIYGIIWKYDTCGTIGDKPRSGLPRKISTGQRTRLKRLVNHQTGISLRRIPQKFNVHRRTIQRELIDMARPFETIWQILEEKVYGGDWEAKTIDQLKRRTQQQLKRIDMKPVQAMFSSIRKQLRKIADKGPFAACSF
ncbi:unnamed protein product [Rotaria socialis]|uniref:Uncharacterized protein n=1 Tax=Rotaria socialis TaxID=392032 RepID=A0A817RMV6_9BILA|nr:unnamed protein product [Rotaria socialis]CAF3636138.1 unnamed protein product [Rotaria socialis]CAF4497812.1 unnamed protein product [Rotaria socialis]CAF4575290.1 unnamed protein product [Rotaria socialis]CAF4796285.1 unnamed protein product [Rotaria socialis]